MLFAGLFRLFAGAAAFLRRLDGPDQHTARNSLAHQDQQLMKLSCACTIE